MIKLLLRLGELQSIYLGTNYLYYNKILCPNWKTKNIYQ